MQKKKKSKILPHNLSVPESLKQTRPQNVFPAKHNRVTVMLTFDLSVGKISQPSQLDTHHQPIKSMGKSCAVKSQWLVMVVLYRFMLNLYSIWDRSPLDVTLYNKMPE